MTQETRIKERKYHCRGKVLRHDPMTNPADGWVTGFYYQDLCGGEIRHFIRNGEMIWEIIPESVGKFMGYNGDGDEIFEGDILSYEHLLVVIGYEEETGMFLKHLYVTDGIDTDTVIMDGGESGFLRGELKVFRKKGNMFDNKNMIRK